MSGIASIRKAITGDVFDYQTLMGLLRQYGKPRDKITRLLASGDIVRVKKGLYCFGEAFRREPVCREYLANLIYGPSYVSLDYALSFHGLIPERVETITSVTTGRSREYTTPLGRFSYRALSLPRYAAGMTLAVEGSVRFLVATPEKALVDKVWTDRRFDGRTVARFGPYLFEDLRVDPEALRRFDQPSLVRLGQAFGARKIDNLLRYLERLDDIKNA